MQKFLLYFPPILIWLVILLGVFLVILSIVKKRTKFLIEECNITKSEDDQAYFVVISLSWSGSNPAVIDSLEVITGGKEPVNIHADNFAYEFCSAKDDEEAGVYLEEEKGETEGLEITDEEKVLLKVSMMDASSDPERKLKLLYTADGKQKEQIIESVAFQNSGT